MAHTPQHLTLAAALGAMTLTVDVWSCPGVKVHLSQDDWLIQPLTPVRLRAVVIDGVTPWRSEHTVGQDAAVWAAGLVRTAARSTTNPVGVLQAAHSALWRPDLTPSRRRPAAAVCVVDLSPDPGRPGLLAVTAASAADCDSWVQAPGGTWGQLTGGDALDPTWRAAWEQEKRQRAFPDIASQLAAEAQFLDSPLCRPHPAAGRDEQLAPTTGTAAGIAAVVLASDGARITPAALIDLEGHVATVCSGDHGDVTVIRAAVQH